MFNRKSNPIRAAGFLRVKNSARLYLTTLYTYSSGIYMVEFCGNYFEVTLDKYPVYNIGPNIHDFIQFIAKEKL